MELVQTDTKAKSVFKSLALTMLGLACVSFLLAATADFSESIWAFTRTFESWQFDELLIAVQISTLGGLIFAVLKISALRTQVAKLQTEIVTVQQKVAPGDDEPEIVVACAICSKYRLDDHKWLKASDFIAQRYDTNLVGGVCPNCGNDFKE